MSDTLMDMTVTMEAVAAAPGAAVRPSSDTGALSPTGAVRLIASWRHAPRPPFVFVEWEGLAPADRLALEARGGKAWFLPELSTEANRQLLAQYWAVTEDVGASSGAASVWWYTWTATRDRHFSKLLEQMEFLARLAAQRRVLAAQSGVVLCVDPVVASAVQHVMGGDGMVRVVEEGRDRLRWLGRRVWWRCRPWLAAARVVRRVLLDRAALRGRAVTLPPITGARPRVLLVTWLQNRHLSGVAPLTTYFGRLPQLLHQRGVDAALFGGLSEAVSPDAVRMPAAAAVPVCSFPEWFRVGDLCRAVMVGMCGRIRVPQTDGLRDPRLRALVDNDIRQSRGNSVVYAILFERALRRLLRRYQPTKIVQIWENNPWEKACQRAADALAVRPEICGYLHTATVLAHTKYVLTPRDRLVRPQPARLICTGIRPREILIRHCGQNPEATVAGCAWRFEHLRNMSPRRQVRWRGQLLVVLEGLPSMVSPLIWFVHRALAGQTAVKAHVRVHPQCPYPWERLLREASLSLEGHPTLAPSKHASLLDDFEEADLVVYKGSTAAIEAGYLGIPLIHVRTPNLITDDPLFEISALKQIVRRPEAFLPALDRLTQMSQAEFDQSVTAFRHYVDGYFAVPTEQTMTPFLPGTAGEGGD